MEQIIIDNKPIPYVIKRNGRSKKVSFRFDGHSLSIVCPSWMSDKEVKGIMNNNPHLISGVVARYKPPQEVTLDNFSLYILGKPHRVNFIDTYEDKITLSVKDDHIELRARPEDRDDYKDVLYQGLRELAKNYLTKRINYLSSKTNISFNRLTVKDQSTRWGSCSSKGNINLNWRLIMAPKEAMDYVIVHELCHTIHMNHSEEFWKLVESFIPDYESQRLWLKENGKKLKL